jgi:hypothetical protein
MARIRTVKPEFWTSEQVTSCSRDARLLFIGMWNFSDDAGVHPKSFKRLKMEVFPGDDCTVNDIEVWVRELIKVGLVKEYEAENRWFWLVTGWNHQRIDKPTYRFPRPEAESETKNRLTVVAESTNPLGNIVEELSNSIGPLDDVMECKGEGVERKGIDICEVPSATSCVSVDSNVNEVFEYWKKKMGYARAKLDAKRKAKIQAAFKLGFFVEDLKQAIEGCSNTPFNMGNNPQNKKYNDIELILRDAAHIERFMQDPKVDIDGQSIDLAVSHIDKISEGAI